MKKPAAILKDIDFIIFDMDGVITSEQNYWNAAALTVNEILFDQGYFGQEKIDGRITSEAIKKIRDDVFCGDKTIALLKERGINTNWDLAYVTASLGLALSSSQGITRVPCNAQKIYESIYYFILEHDDFNGMQMYQQVASLCFESEITPQYNFERGENFWFLCQKVFQEWYLGDETSQVELACSMKKGLITSETPLFPLRDLHNMLETLLSSGYEMGIGTGRPAEEILQPMAQWDIQRYFKAASIITYSDVIESERILNQQGIDIHLSKPHPYMFLKSALGKLTDDRQIIQNNFEYSDFDRVLVVGDAGSDIMAAKAAGMKFAAVLTGISGKKARTYFEEMKADYILDNVLALVEDQ